MTVKELKLILESIEFQDAQVYIYLNQLEIASKQDTRQAILEYDNNGHWSWSIDLDDLEAVIIPYEEFNNEQDAKDHAEAVAKILKRDPQLTVCTNPPNVV